MKFAATVLACIVAPCAVVAAQGGEDIDARIAGSAAAAQDLQGPLDGAWTLTDLNGRALLRFQIVDPVSRRDDIEAAWRAATPGGAIGVASNVRRRGGRLAMRIDDPGESARISLRQVSADRWRGVLTQGERMRAVSLRRGP